MYVYQSRVQSETKLAKAFIDKGDCGTGSIIIISSDDE
jgi:hypothetical protein